MGGAAVAALGGTTTADPGGGQGVRTDDVFGAPYAADDKVPSGKVDHEVGLHAHPPEGPEHPPEFFFEPVGLHVGPGDVVRFANVPHGPPGSRQNTLQAFHDKFDIPSFADIPHLPTASPGSRPPC